MAKILDSIVLNGSIQKVVELPQGYIMNGHYYDKSQMIPKPLQSFNMLGNYVDISMDKKAILKHGFNGHGKSQGDTVVTDRYDSTISYVWTTGMRNNAPYMYKFKESNGTIALLATSASWANLPAANPYVRACIGQDANSLYYLVGSGATWTESLYKVDKISLAATSIEAFSTYTWASSLMETDNFAYYARKTGYGTCYIKRYNKTSQAIEALTTTARTSNIYYSSNWSNLWTVSSTEQYSYSVYHVQASNTYKIARYKFDTTQAVIGNVMTEVDANITWGTVTALPVFPSSCNYHYESFITTAQNGNKYLSVMVYDPTASVTANVQYYGVYTFLIDPTTKDLTFKSFNSFTTDYIRGFVGVSNNTFLTVGTDNSTLFLNFDQNLEKFVVSDSLGNQPNHIGADQSGNIWITNVNNEVEYFSPSVPTNVYVNYELGGYQYQGTDINTYITVEAKNFTGTDIATNLQLTIKGNAVFASSGTKVITNTTSTSGPQQIPIIIKGSGSITVYPQLLI